MNQHLERLDQMAKFLQLPAHEFVRQVQARLGVIVLIVYTYRDFRVQQALYQQGREYDRAGGMWRVVDQKAVVTNAKPGQSAHNVVDADGQPAAMGMDIIPLDDHGAAVWNYASELWVPIYQIAIHCGFDPYGDPAGASVPSDAGHMEEGAWKMKVDGLGLVILDAVTQQGT